ncbi:hypothetical protein, partial [Mesorhizobium sp. M0590]|uniref:hypothetical protein n=1 Tax=Mesorhizobium sp. M0590 TaxID=2956966 RepID=UPI00333DE618
TTVPWPLAPQSKRRSLSKTFCRTFSTLSDLVGYNYLRRGNQLIRISAWEREYLGRSLMITLSLAFLDIAAPLG